MSRLAIRPEGLLALVVAAYLVLAFGYARVTPIWQNPDEPAHYNYLLQVARTATLPELLPGDWNSDLNFRVKTGEIDPDHPDVAGMRYEGWQPPLYYLISAAVLRVLGSGQLESDVLLLRGMNVLFGALTLVVAFAAARQVFCWRSGMDVRLAAIAVPTALAGIPMFTAVSASISADPLANLVCAALFLILLRALAVPLTTARAIGLGLLLGLGMLTKVGAVIFLPLTLIVLLVRRTAPWRSIGLVLGTAAVVLTPWLLRQMATYGWNDPFASNRHDQVVFDQARFPGFSVVYGIHWLTDTYHSFWAQFGWMAIPAPERMYWGWGLLSLLGAVGLLITFVRRPERRLDTRVGLSVLTVLLAAAAYVAYNLSFQQAQGRYLFPALVPFCVLLVLGWSAWFPPRWTAVGPTLLSLGLLGLNAYTLTRILAPAFR